MPSPTATPINFTSLKCVARGCVGILWWREKMLQTSEWNVQRESKEEDWSKYCNTNSLFASMELQCGYVPILKGSSLYC